MSKTIRLNGKPTVTDAQSIADLVDRQGAKVKGRGVAVARNRVVVHREEWPETPVAEGDQIEIIRPIVGG